ncbi:Transmembrane protein 180 [Trichoplax sp. H2]|nr:Transmembrane protein 180 [Trichoplax sp. H2]|eukprot:RDD47341.1 Transmembrane protein 180 [Trichoplax sp. H2]
MSITKSAIAYASTTLAASMMNSIFQFYYIKLFLNGYRINNTWFYRAQLIYLVWNAINDPLFGYLQDSSKVAFSRRRRTAILYGAPIFALSFLIPWIPWTAFGDSDWVVGMHLITSLCFYDGMFTYVLLAQCALFAEIATKESDRQTVLKYSQIASIIGSSAVLFTELISQNLKYFRYFQICCVVIASISYFAMTYTARYAINISDAESSNSVLIDSGEDDNPLSDITLYTLFKQITTNKQFALFVLMNFLQIFHNTIGSNFFSIFADNLIGSSLLPQARSIMAGSAFVLPQILVLLFSPLLARFGSYRCIMVSFFVKFALALAMFLSGPSNMIFLIFFMVLDRSLPEATFSLFNLSVSDIIDDDRAKYKRRAPISSMIFGTNALFTKPAQSLAPMFVVSFLTGYGYQHGSQAVTIPAKPELRQAMFSMICLVPIVASVIQILIWSFYSLRGQRVKNHGFFGASV